MLEIIALIFLCKKNGALAARKGLKSGTWKAYTVLAWIIAEVFGLIIGMQLFGQTNIIGVMGIGIFGAFGGYLVVKYILENKPDETMEEEINQIGVDDLRPPKNNPN